MEAPKPPRPSRRSPVLAMPTSGQQRARLLHPLGQHSGFGAHALATQPVCGAGWRGGFSCLLGQLGKNYRVLAVLNWPGMGTPASRSHAPGPTDALGLGAGHGQKGRAGPSGMGAGQGPRAAL